ncbi:GNAT family N-acetyltransferase [Planococcus sp. 107-1]|uniref:GNAT family N-acetyltransferase n=1 Tax=Planococcus sp. 107-1 TaxID=2908840 RepID=UPI001F280E4F|nr:GNAT family N-acetyltransferase [Planococcus sp. 107-1]UJF27083.1 GNAT family N-acetyltransferase [Planococcus sp. 107-1]
MRINSKELIVRGISYTIRSAEIQDARQLSEVRLQIDGETENMDREKGEAYIDCTGFEKIIEEDTQAPNHLFLVAEVDGAIVGFSRCEGNSLKRTAHKVEFGVCMLQAYWGYGIGGALLSETLDWTDAAGIKKVVLTVLETNEKAIKLYEKHGFNVEGILRQDKLLSDGNYYNTVVMGRISI